MIQTHGIDRDDTRSDLARDLLQRLETARAGIGPDLSAGGAALLLVLALAAAAAVQASLFLNGLYSLSADESARALLAHRITLSNAFDPFIWPPFATILNRLALGLYDDLFLTPRLLVAIVGLLAVIGIAFVTYRAFGNRLMAVIAAILAVLVPQRLLLSVAPLSDIVSTTLVVFAAGFVMGWLRGGRPVDLLAASGLLFLAAMTRYELWFVNATLALYLTYRGFIRRDLGLGQVILNGALLAAFPIYWVLHSYAYFGDLHIFSQASRQFIDLYGRNHIEAMKLNVATDLVRDAAFDPLLILGASLTGFLALQRREMRDWAILFFAPLLALAVQMAISLGVPLAASFRIDGPWVLLLLPAGAFGLVFAAEKVTANETRRWIVLAFATYVAMVPSGLETHMLAKAMQAPGVLDGDDLALGRYLRRLAAHDGHRILLDAVGSLDYLNVPVAANLPDRVTLDVDEEPVAVATFMDARKTYEARHNEAVIERYLTDKFHLADGLDVAKLKVRNIGYLVVQYPPFLRALDRNPRVTKTAGFGKWVVYALKP